MDVESHERPDVVIAERPDVLIAERPDVVIARLAERQHGVVARRQLLAAGLGREAIAHRIRVGRLYCLYRGVYAAGHRLPSPEARWMAAVLAAGRRAVLSHRSAAALWGIRHWRGANVDVTVPSSRQQRPGVRWHVTNLAADEITSLAAIPVTTVPRTLLDLAAVLDHRGVERAINEAEVRRYTDPLSLPALLARYPRRTRYRGDPRHPRRGRSRCHAYPERAGRALPAIPRSLGPPSAGAERSHRGARRVRGGGLRLAPVAPDHRAGRAGLPRDRRGLRARSGPGPGSQRRRMAGRPDHLAPAQRRGEGTRGRPWCPVG